MITGATKHAAPKGRVVSRRVANRLSVPSERKQARVSGRSLIRLRIAPPPGRAARKVFSAALST
jgi:hypothetical protein